MTREGVSSFQQMVMEAFLCARRDAQPSKLKARSKICPSNQGAPSRECMHKDLQTAAAAAKSLQSCPTLCDPIVGSPPGSLSLGFSSQEHWSGLPFPSPVHESGK